MTRKADKNMARTGVVTDMQKDFADSLIWRQDGLPDAITSHNCARPVKRFNIYRNNVFVSLIETLKKRYPVIERLVGEEFFKAAAHRHICQSPPRSAVLMEYGGDFPDFIEQFEPARPYPYLGDVARLEWLKHLAYHAADAAPILAEHLGQIPPEHLGDTQFTMHPAMHLLRSDFPVYSIWHTNSHDENPRRIVPEHDGEAVMIVRPGLAVGLIRLTYADHHFTHMLSQGARLADAMEETGAAFPEFQLPEILATLISQGAIADATHYEKGH